MRPAALVGALAAVSLAVLTGGVRTQEPAQPTFKTEANYVRVDVYPTLDGAPVTDLTRDDFEVLEDNVPQTIDAFERVFIRGGGSQEIRTEPSTVAESRAMLENARARVFVIFLDVNHVTLEGSRNIRAPLISALDSLIGPDDLVGVMTPEMSASDVTFARRTTTIEGMLSRHWAWGERGRIGLDEREQAYRQCYPGLGPSRLCADDDRGVADEMIARRREKQTLDAVSDLVDFLRGVREERKALLMISEGWLLYRPNQALARRLNCAAPLPEVGIDPRTGRLSNSAPQQSANVPLSQCDSDRMRLAQLDDATDFQMMLNRANRANVTFYPVDPRGLVVFDTPIDQQRTGTGATTIVPPSVDSAMLRSRQGALRDLASATDGTALMNSNDLAAGFRRVVADLSSYYLLGYYSGGKLDGKYHAIRVRVKRPGVQVRARRGYLAATLTDAAKAAATSASAPAPPSAEATALNSAISALGGFAREAPLRVTAVAGWKPGNKPALWAVGEIAAGDQWRGGGNVDLTLATPAGDTIATTHEHVAAGARSFRVAFDIPAPAEYSLRVHATPADGGVATGDTLRISVPASPAATGAIVFRKGPATANRSVPTADLRFRRGEQIQIDLPSPDGSWTARLLDRAGKAMKVPLAVTVRDDADGTRWHTTTLPVAPFAPSDYVIEMEESAGKERILVAFRVVP